MNAGSCLCGAVRFEVREFSGGVFKCHCSKCRKAFGGASSAAVLAPAGALVFLAGEEGVREYRTDSGFLRRFCGTCGSILPQYLPDHDLYWIPAGLLEGDPGLRLGRHIHVDSKAAWELLDADTRRHGEGFDSPQK